MDIFEYNEGMILEVNPQTALPCVHSILLSLFVISYVCSALAHSGSAARGRGGGSVRGRKHILAS
jgi:hypothetical protein